MNIETHARRLAPCGSGVDFFSRLELMSRSTLNFFVDLLLASLFLFVLTVVGVVHLTFPPASQASGWTVWGWSYDTWSNAEFIAVALFAICVIVHLILHWTWVYGFVATRLARRFNTNASMTSSIKTLYGVMILIIVLTTLGGILLAAEFSAKAPVETSEKLISPP